MHHSRQSSIARATLAAAVMLGLIAPALTHAQPAAPKEGGKEAKDLKDPAKDGKTPPPPGKEGKDPKKDGPPPAGTGGPGTPPPGPGPGPGAPGGRPSEMSAFSPSQIEESMQLLRDIDPDLFTKIGELRTKNPERVAAVLFQHLPRLAPLVVLKKSDPALFKLKIKDMKLDRETHEAVKALRSIKDKDETKIKDAKAKILEMVTHQFYVRQEIREHELASLEKKVGELRDQIEARKDAREKLIEDRVKQLTGKEETAEW